MRLQKVKAREYKGKPIYKYMVVIPPKDIEKLGWKGKNDLSGYVVKDLYCISLKK